MALQHTLKLASIPRHQRLRYNAPVRIAGQGLVLSTKVGGKSLVLRRTHISMVRCQECEPVRGIAWRRQDGWDTWLGSRKMSTQKSAKVCNPYAQTNNWKSTTKNSTQLSRSTTWTGSPSGGKHQAIKSQSLSEAEAPQLSEHISFKILKKLINLPGFQSLKWQQEEKE